MLGQDNIAEALGTGEMNFAGNLRGNALLLTLGGPIQTLIGDGGAVDPYDEASVASLYADPVEKWERFILRPQGIVLAQVREEITFGASLAGMIGTLSHVARLGIATHLDSPNVDANFSGWLTLEITNSGPRSVILKPGMPIAKVTVFRIEGGVGGPQRHIFYGDRGSLGSRFFDEFKEKGNQP